jgi:uncharacterized protein (DUF433 family)
LRITVYEVLEYLASGMSQEEILRDFPDLEAEDIKACLVTKKANLNTDRPLMGPKAPP